MKATAEINAAYSEYAFFIEALRVAGEAEAKANPKNMTDEEAEYYGEALGEICMERALGGSLSPRNDAERIYRATRVTRALNAFARNAPLHAEACECLINSMYI